MDAELQAKWGVARLARSPRRHPVLFTIFVFVVVFALTHKWFDLPIYAEHLSTASQIDVLARDTTAGESQSDTTHEHKVEGRWPVGALYVPKWDDIREKMSSLGLKMGKREEQEEGQPPADDGRHDVTIVGLDGPLPYFQPIGGYTGPPPTVKLPQGTYEGKVNLRNAVLPRDVHIYNGIPYAQSTANENRFRPPRPLPASNETFQANSPGSLCPTPGRVASPTTTVSEDCLNLNIYRRSVDYINWTENVTIPYPVAIYIHGGGFNDGASDERDMASFVSWGKDSEGILGVSFNYRVGPLGFLPVDEWGTDGKPMNELNVGLQDQRKLFEWVQENIEAFGGDKNNVTLIGQSAGAHAIGHHLLYYGRPEHSGPAPFHRAILESGGSTARSVFAKSHPRTETQLSQFLDKLSFGDFPRERLRPALRSLPVETLMKAASEVWDENKDDGTWPFQPVIDGPGYDVPKKLPAKWKSDKLHGSSLDSTKHQHQHQHRSTCGECAYKPLVRPETLNRRRISDPIIAEIPMAALERGDFLRIPILTGFSTNEGATLLPAGTPADTDGDFRRFFRKLIPGFKDADFNELSALYEDPAAYPNRTDTQYGSVPPGKGPQWARLEAAYSDYAYICPVIQTAAFFSTVHTNLSNPYSAWKSCGGDVSFPPPTPDTTFPEPPRCPPVFLYHYAALSGTNKMAGHSDAAALISHDISAVDPHKEKHPHPGLLAVSDAMHGAWSRFVATGEVSDAGLDWEPVTGLIPSVNRRADKKERGIEERSSDGLATSVMVFGEGNDEAAEENHKGTAAKMAILGRDRMIKCRFWWPRAELSEGMGLHRQGLEEWQRG